MSHETFRRLVSGCLGGQHPFETVAFIWHGGEPTIVRPEWYRRAFQIQDEFRGPTQTVVNGIQTNGTLLSPEWLTFLADRPDVHVSVSIDGVKSTHDRLRLNVRGHGTWDRVVAGTEQLREHDIPFGLLFVLSQEMLRTDPAETFDTLLSLGPRSLDFVPARPPNANAFEPSPAETVNPQFAQALHWQPWAMRFFDRWWSSQSATPVRAFESVMSTMIGAAPQLCVLGTNCFGSVMAVEPDGTIGSCDIFLGEDGHQYGLAGDDLWALAQGEEVRTLSIAEEARQGAMAESCRWGAFCRGGCPHDHLVHAQQGVPKEQSGCCGWAQLYDHMAAHVSADLGVSGGAVPVRLTTRR